MKTMKVIYGKTDKHGISRVRSEKKAMTPTMAQAMSKLADVACVVAYETERSTTCYVNGRLVQTSTPMYAL